MIILIILIINSILNILFKQNNILGCGLIGFSGKGKYNYQLIRMLMLLNLKRGKDAAGYYTPIANDFYYLNKDGESVDINIIYNKAIEEGLYQFIGHCRQASYGVKKKENAHPFLAKNEKNIIVAHNGTLTNLYDLRVYFKDKVEEKYKSKFEYENLDVDSKIFSEVMSIFDKEKALEVFQYYEGAAALLFSDLNQPEILYAYTDGERPLHYGFRKEGMYISSEKEPLMLIECNDIKPFSKNKIYTIKNGIIENISKKIDKKKLPIKNIQSTTSNNRSNNHSNSNSNNTAVSVINNATGKFTSLQLNVKELREFLTWLNSNVDLVEKDIYRKPFIISAKINSTYELIVEYENKLKDCLWIYRDFINPSEEITIKYNKNLNDIILNRKIDGCKEQYIINNLASLYVNYKKENKNQMVNYEDIIINNIGLIIDNFEKLIKVSSGEFKKDLENAQLEIDNYLSVTSKNDDDEIYLKPFNDALKILLTCTINKKSNAIITETIDLLSETKIFIVKYETSENDVEKDFEKDLYDNEKYGYNEYKY